MHTLAVQLAPLLGAEKSKAPFYVAGGLLVVWALVVSLMLGLRKPDFPGDLTGQRIVSAISVVLVLGAVSTAVLTSGGSKAAEAAAGAQPSEGPQAATTPATTSQAPSSTTPAAGSGKGSELALSADPTGLLRFSTTQLSAKAGKVKITFSNSAQLEHNFTIAEVSKVIGATPTFTGGSRSLTLQLKPGKYTFYCTVPGHRQAGMEGTLTVS